MFRDADSFRQSLADWTVSQIVDRGSMFAGSTSRLSLGFDHWRFPPTVCLGRTDHGPHERPPRLLRIRMRGL